MTRLALVFLVLALVSAFFGFAGAEETSWAAGKVGFMISLVLAFVTFLAGAHTRRSS